MDFVIPTVFYFGWCFVRVCVCVYVDAYNVMFELVILDLLEIGYRSLGPSGAITQMVSLIGEITVVWDF